MMAGIRGKDTKPELAVRRAVHARGLRYRLHATRLPGKPDLVFSKYRAAVFVHGCFWHRHEGCRLAYRPKSREEFWEKKLTGNSERDQRNQRLLMEMGWRVYVVWECEVNERRINALVEEICA